MNWLFRGDLSLITRLSLLEVYNRLTNLIGKEDSENEFKKKYVGAVYEKGFKLKKAYRQLFSPPRYSVEFIGEISSDNQNTLINVKIRPNAIMLFGFRACLVPISVLIINTIIPFSELPSLNSKWSFFWLAFGLMIYFGNLIGYNRESKRISKELISDLSAKLI
jgi:hypothetical protein